MVAASYILCCVCFTLLGTARTLHLQSSPVENGTKCTRFLVLTMQRSGSCWTAKALSNQTGIMCSGEAFNLGPNQAGEQIAKRLGLSRGQIKQNGAVWWSNKVFETLEIGIGGMSPCAVGFRAFEGQLFSFQDLAPLLRDPQIKKIILERGNSTAQFVSKQRACWFNDFGGHHDSDNTPDELRATENHISNGEFCPQGSNLQSYIQQKRTMYGRWYDLMQETEQDYLAVKTEELDNSVAVMVNFILGMQANQKLMTLTFDHFNIDIDDE